MSATTVEWTDATIRYIVPAWQGHPQEQSGARHARSASAKLITGRSQQPDISGVASAEDGSAWRISRMTRLGGTGAFRCAVRPCNAHSAPRTNRDRGGLAAHVPWRHGTGTGSRREGASIISSRLACFRRLTTCPASIADTRSEKGGGDATSTITTWDTPQNTMNTFRPSVLAATTNARWHGGR